MKLKIIEIWGIVVPGSGAASGKIRCREIGGTIKAQRPFFASAGVDMSTVYDGTLNVLTAGYRYEIKKPDCRLTAIKWSATYPSEDFSLVSCFIQYRHVSYRGYVYYPHPETKIGRFPGHSLVEILTEYIPGIGYGKKVGIAVDANKMTFTPLTY